MQNLRIVNVTVPDSTEIGVAFTESLTSNLVTSNVSIISETPGSPDSEVLKVTVLGFNLVVQCQPLTPLASYVIQFQSVPLHAFESVNGNARISEDGVSNRFIFSAPLEPENPIKSYLDSFLYGNIYKNEDDNTLISKYIKSLSLTLSRALYDIRQAGNENYLSFDVIDEAKTRGGGAFDRLNEEGAYQILRVGRTPAGTNVSKTFSFEIFPFYPITLQRELKTETLTSNSVDEDGFFNINSLTFNFSNTPVTRVNSITFTLNTANPIYEYDIERLGYQIKDSRYDQEFGFDYLQLENNQIRISDKILQDPLFSLDKILSVFVEYESKNLGIVVDATTVSAFAVTDVPREVLPPIINIFNLANAPIVDYSNNIPTLGGATFTDPNSNTGSPHPAFVSEIPFRLNALPFFPGQYSIDYTTGTVYVYGNDFTNDGTGPYPPLVSYKYRLVYQPEIDYIYDPDTLDLVSLPHGSLRDFAGSVTFRYEEVLIPNVDYKGTLHQENLQERIGNKLVALNSFKVENSPITNVFRIFNETTGEIYNLDRWNNDKVYFKYNQPPRLFNQVSERATFEVIPNELLFVNTTLVNGSALDVYKIFLNNNTIVSSTEDSLASSFNTSIVFTDANVFEVEKWFDPSLSEAANINKLLEVGEYVIDYDNGVIYCAVVTDQSFDIGTVTYKKSSIVTNFPHVISVDDIYYRISPLESKNKQFSYTSFFDGGILPETLDLSSEQYLNDSVGSPYQLNAGSIGVFDDSGFIAGVTNKVKFVRSVFEFDDLSNSSNPFNFAFATTSDNFNITVDSITRQFFDVVQQDVDGYFITINENVPYLSSNITYTFEVERVSDSLPLWDLSGTVVPGNPLRLTLSGLNTPNVGDQVSVTYTFEINDLSRVVIDYNRGDYFVDYTYLADEIIVSYEYGDNVLDFREGHNLDANTEYFVSYRAGALRDALLKNFGTLVNIPELSVFDTDFNRERYRDALTAALTSFIQGPTVSAIKNIGKTISHIQPEIIESAFLNWSLGSSLLFPESINTTGDFQLLPAKFGDGVLINSLDQTIKFPASSNLRLEEGTFETWVAPQWNGLDNDAVLTFSILKDGYVIEPNEVFIGAGEQHPTISGGVFSLEKNSEIMGVPNFSKDGVFIYYDGDTAGDFDRWFVRVIDGYVTAPSSSYRFQITSTGGFYDSKSIILPKPSNLSIFTGTNSLNFSLTGGSPLDEGVTFLSDLEHYILDVGEERSKNRLSLYKDISGYLSFRVFDQRKVSYTISADVSDWRAGDLHHVAISWKLNNYNGKDELHLFVDGFEVPNIIKFGQKLRPYLHEKFKTVTVEEVAGFVDKDVVGSIDLVTTAGSTIVSSSINFDAFTISPGNIIYIDEIGFDSAGYTIVTVNGQELTLGTPMPLTLTNGRYSVNRSEFIITSDIDTAPNTAVSVMHAVDGYTDLVTTADSAIVSSSFNFETAGVEPGNLIHIYESTLEPIYTIVEVSGTTVTLSDSIPDSFTGLYFSIYDGTEEELPGTRALRPDYSITKDGYTFDNILTISNNLTIGDMILVKTLGLNHKKVKKQYYCWSDGQENVLMTQLPAPISLDEASIRKVIVPATAIGPSNSTVSLGIFTSNNLPGSSVSNSQVGRTISINLSGTNTNFTTPVTVTINGTVGVSTVNEILTFTDYGAQDSVNMFINVNYINVVVKPTNVSRAALVVDAKEKYSITHSENSGLVPVVKYSYHIGGGYTLQDDGYGIVRDENFLFSALDTNNYLVIHSPVSVAGYYIITGMSEDRKSIYIESTNQSIPLPLPSFTDGIYQVLNVSDYRSGLQNGFFTFEASLLPSQPYFLSNGFYELEYSTHTRIQLDPINEFAYVGSDFNETHQFNGIIDEIKVYSSMLTDTRVGESIPANQRSITKDFNSLKALRVDSNTLMLIRFDSFPFANEADVYINGNEDKHHFQSSSVINENFGNSLVILDKPIIIENDGILDTKKQGTIEFWVNPLFDTSNDPTNRFYFDAYGAVIEETVSTDNVSVKLSAPASQILSVKLKAGDTRVDYFAGGKLEIDTQHAIQETVTSLSSGSAAVARSILQVITVKIVGDLTGTDYFAGGSIGTDRKTIYLGKTLPSSSLSLVITYQTTENKNVKLNTQVIRLNRKLPYQNTQVVVQYIPQGLQGDRISLYKDSFGYINFDITADGTHFVVRAPTRWAKDTWHRVKASYKINGGIGQDELKLFLDGYEYTDVTFGSNILFGKFPIVMGSAMPGGFVANDGYAFLENIRFRDSINNLFIGSQFTGESPIFSLIDNFRISNISRPIYAPYGEPLDVNYSTNLSSVLPVTRDLFTTYLMDYDKMIILNDDFAILKNRKTGLFDFSVNILDSFGIVNDNIKSQEALEALIKVLKPANSRVFIQYIR